LAALARSTTVVISPVARSSRRIATYGRGRGSDVK
jgi:hypothetical protein